MTTENAGSPYIELRHRQQACENDVFSVFLDHVVDNAGREVPNYLSVIPKHTAGDMLTGVCVLPVVEGDIGLLKVFRHPLGRWSWEVPRGFIDEGESPGQAALRELAEEMGLAASAENLRDLGTVAPEAGVLRARVRLFAATVAESARLAAKAELGHGGRGLFPPAAVVAMIANGGIEDACTIIAALKYIYSRSGSTTES